MKVIILAAGIGSRLRPLTNKKPKGMVKVNGVPIIEHQIRAYIEAGVSPSNINIVVGYKSSFIDDFLNSKYPEVKIISNHEYDTTNNMFSLQIALNSIQEDSVIISNGDCVYDYTIIEELINSKERNCVASDKGSFTDENMKIIVSDNKITHISKGITEDEAYGNSIDLYKIDIESVQKFSSLIDGIVSKDKNLWSELALDKLFGFVDFIPFDIKRKKWMEIDNYDDLYEAEKKFSKLSIENKKCFVLDLDGTVYLGNTPIKGAIDFINENANTYDIYFMTNNTSKNLENYVEKLHEFKIETSLDKIISPIIPLVEYLNGNQIKNIFVVGNENFKSYLQNNITDLQFVTDESICEAVVIAYDTELNYEKLKVASLLLHNSKVKLLATHEDIVCPTEKGDIPDIGTILKTIELTTDRTPNVVFGKPNSILLDSILSKYTKDEIVIVGDRLYTDKVLANDSNIDFVLVLSGETKREDIEELPWFPESIVRDLGEVE